MKILLAIVVGALILIGAFFALNSYIYNEKQGTGGEPGLVSTNQAPAFSWTIDPSARFEETMPWQNVWLRVNGDGALIGEYQNCSVDESMPEGAVTAVTCWFAGGGNDIAVFKEGEGYVVKERFTQEAGEEGADTEGEWETKLAL